jgi:hypothetical protein
LAVGPILIGFELKNNEFKMKRKVILLICSVIVTNACKKSVLPQLPDEVLGKVNELENEVVDHFAEQTDLVKLNAAKFLLANVGYHSHQTGEKIQGYKDEIDNWLPTDPIERDRLMRSLRSRFKDVGDSVAPDVFLFDGKRLVDHVDQVIDFYRETMWHAQIPFDVFCEYLLPYNINSEQISPWGQYFRDGYFYENDSSVLKNKIEDAIAFTHQWIYEQTLEFALKWGTSDLNIPNLSPILIDKLMMGSCLQLAERSAAMMRAMGIPAAIDNIPSYLDYGTGHSWCAAIIDSSHFIPFEATTQELYVYRNNDYKIPKVYRRTFSIQKDSHFIKTGEKYPFLPQLFNDPFSKDVTGLYTETSDLKIPVTKGSSEKTNDKAYLTVFSRDDGWRPVDWGPIKKDTACFKNVGRGGVYLPMHISETGKAPLSYPFLLNDSGEIRILKPELKNVQTMKLLRKFPLSERKSKFINRMMGGVFQGANIPDFVDAVTLATIDSFPGEYFNTLLIDEERPFRYVRYLAPKNSYGNVAEIEFYDRASYGTQLSGKIIGITEPGNGKDDTSREKAFDGDVLTFFAVSQADYAWVGLDLGKRAKIKKIRFIARNDKNAIQKENEYELFFWNNAWISLGRKVAADSVLTYERIPSSALYFLHNRTEGKEERIFTYENGEQVWW